MSIKVSVEIPIVDLMLRGEPLFVFAIVPNSIGFYGASILVAINLWTWLQLRTKSTKRDQCACLIKCSALNGLVYAFLFIGSLSFWFTGGLAYGFVIEKLSMALLLAPLLWLVTLISRFGSLAVDFYLLPFLFSRTNRMNSES